MNMNRLLPVLLLSTFSAGASAALVTVDAGNYNFSYDDTFWNTAAFSQSGDTFSFSNLSRALDTRVSGSLNHPDGFLQKNYAAVGSPSASPNIWVTADAGFRLTSITTGVQGITRAKAAHDPANLDGSLAAATMMAHIVWKDGPSTPGQALFYNQVIRNRDAAGLPTAGTSGPYDLSHTSIFGRSVFNVAGDFYAEGRIQMSGAGVSATTSLDTAYFNVAVVPIPEPETWAMFLGGLGVLGVVARRRKRTET